MMESLNNLSTIREYLLGRIFDEKMLAGIEDLLFTDEDFCTKAEITEDELINDYVFENLNAKDSSSFEKTLENNAERRLKVQVTQALKDKVAVKTVEEKTTFFDAVKAFFRSPVYAGSFAVLLIAALIGTILIFRSPKNDELAELKNIYQKERPIEPRITGFDYAPLNVTRGENKDNVNKNKLEEIKLERLKAVNSNPNAENYHKLGVFYLTRQNYKDAIENLENAVKADDKNAAYHNDLGSAYFQFAELNHTFENLSNANEHFAKALELNPNLLEALFNKALTLQGLNLPRQTKESWELYLNKDSTSKWADEARKNLEKIAQTQSSLKKNPEDVLRDFLTAYRNRDETTVWKIHNATKGLFTNLSLSEQLTRRYLEAKQNKDDPTANESIEALTYIGNLEKEKHADFFFADLAEYYAKLDDSKIEILFKAKNLVEQGFKLQKETKYSESIKVFEQSKKLYAQIGNNVELNVADIWFTQMLRDVGRYNEAFEQLSLLAVNSEKKNHKVIAANAFDWLANAEYGRNNLSKSIVAGEKALKIAEESENIYEIIQNNEGMASVYLDLGETENALLFFNQANLLSDLYFQNNSQFWRNTLCGAELTRHSGNLTTSIDFGKESFLLAEESIFSVEAVNNSIRELTKSLVEKKDFDEALILADKAVELTANMPDSDEKTLLVAAAFLQRANLRNKAKHFESALSDYDKSLELYGQKPETLFNLYQIHKGKLLCFQSLERRQDFEDELEIVDKFSEDYRKNIREDNSRQAFFENEQEVFDLATENALKQNDGKKAFEFVEKNKGRSLLDFVKSPKSIAAVEKDFGNPTTPYSLSEIQSQMPENVQIVEYSVLPDKLAVWLITKNSFELIEKPVSTDSFEKNLNDYRKAILDKDESESGKNIARELYELLIPKNLERGKILCIVPDKALYQIPFASLISSENKYLIEDFAVLYSPSSSVFLTLTANAKAKPSGEKLLSIGNPKFDREENSYLPDLPEAKFEAEEVSKNYANSQIFTGNEATKANFLGNFKAAQIIHFAGHFVANERISGNSKMLFADTALRSYELSDIKLPKSKLVVLSACDTGLEKLNTSEGAIGIARTFLALGTPLVISTNRKVDSSAAQKLMISFHQKRKSGNVSSIEALRESQIEMLKTKEFGSPYYWSAFSATGGLTEY